MKEFVDPFLYNCPQLDLHGYDSSGAVAKVIMFIDENIKLDNKNLIVVHGKGMGILKNAIHSYLKTDKRVMDYKISMYNDGQTIINLF